MLFSTTTTSTLTTANGIVYRNGRLMITLPVRGVRFLDTMPSVNVLFLYDTGSPLTTLTVEAFHAIFPRKEIPPSDFNVLVNGVITTVRISCMSHENVCLLGYDFIMKKATVVEIDYVDQRFKFTFS